MSEITAKIITDSTNRYGNRLTSFIITYPRFVLAEINTHRMLSRNTASSRAIPINRIIDQVKNNPAMPIRWGKIGKGMQDHGYYDVHSNETYFCKKDWLAARDKAVEQAVKLKNLGLHKQIVNRILEPFMWTTTLISGTEWENFFALRVNKAAQPEFQHLAHLMLKEYVNHEPQYKESGEWHIPFGDQMPKYLSVEDQRKVAVARAARVSYNTFDGEINIEKDIQLHNQLLEAGHMSPFEHCAYAYYYGSGNFRGWFQYRHTLPNENRSCNLKQLLEDYENEKI